MSKLEVKLKELPKSPGVYFYRDKAGKIIYVGKAANLKNRVRSYFQKGRAQDWKTPVLVSEIAHVEWTVCESEIDALFLESEMIKRYQPKYNVDLKDEKNHLFVRMTSRSDHPTIAFVRRPLDDGATYFGPFMDATGLRSAMRYLRRPFPYSTHNLPPKRACLQYHLGLCPGIEEYPENLSLYRKNLRKLAMFLRGERVRLIGQLEAEMHRAAKAQDFELAVLKRNQAHSLRALGKQIVFGEAERYDLKGDQALNGLVKLLSLAGVPRRIETYDISHISGSDNVASMVVFKDGVAAKSEYRKFKMHLPGNDDFAHMREVMLRRFSGGSTANWPKPDLLVVDGGVGQLTAAQTALDEKAVKIPAIGLAKREETIIRQITDLELSTSRYEELKLDKDSEILQLLQRMRDEAHRFAVSYHTLLRGQRQTSSILESLPGFGPATRKKLIKHFGSLRGVRAANQSELIQVLGPKRADQLKQLL